MKDHFIHWSIKCGPALTLVLSLWLPVHPLTTLTNLVMSILCDYSIVLSRMWSSLSMIHSSLDGVTYPLYSNWCCHHLYILILWLCVDMFSVLYPEMNVNIISFIICYINSSCIHYPMGMPWGSSYMCVNLLLRLLWLWFSITYSLTLHWVLITLVSSVCGSYTYPWVVGWTLHPSSLSVG